MEALSTKFGELLKEFRLREGYGLRTFAGLIEMPASNLSAIEHGRRQMPQDKLLLAAEVLGLEKGTNEWAAFFDSAASDDEIPADVQMVINKSFIPALLRTIDNYQLNDKDVQKLIKEIQGKK